MPLSIDQIRTLIADKLADNSLITPVEHREVENALVDYLLEVPKAKVLTVETIAVDRNFTVNTLLPAGSLITNVMVMLECKLANNGYVIGDTVTAPTPYPIDAGRTAGQGIGIIFTNTNNAVINIVINDDVHIMSRFVGQGTIGLATIIGSWKLKLFVNYI